MQTCTPPGRQKERVSLYLSGRGFSGGYAKRTYGKTNKINTRIYFLINNGMQVPATMYYSLDQTT